ncbi:hypothetical protein DW157_10060 [Bacteroides eggerthii]|nr:hypothetical protein DW157_10060 [Bacteroides eggerthii]
MKQYVDYYGKGTKKVPLPVDFHLEQAVGALTLHTGRNYMIIHGHKKCQRLCWRYYPPVQNGSHCKYGDNIWKCKKKAEFFVPPISIIAISDIF